MPGSPITATVPRQRIQIDIATGKKNDSTLSFDVDCSFVSRHTEAADGFRSWPPAADQLAPKGNGEIDEYKLNGS